MPNADEGLLLAGPAALAERVRAGELHPRELVELALGRIEALNPRLNAFRIVLAEEALAAADQTPRDGPLAGVPIAVKGDTPVAGQVTARGSRAQGPAEPADAEIVRRLRAAGAIPVGITNVPELMIWPWTASDATGITRNPWDLSRTPGGSSGGSAAAVAAGLVACATGSDGGGSIRIPAACCGLVGMKPTRGRVSMMPAGDHWLGLSTFGPLARTVQDSALMLDVMRGATSADAHSLPPPRQTNVEAVATSPSRLRIAITSKPPPGVLARCSEDQRRAWERTAALLSELGHEVVERAPSWGAVGPVFTETWLRGIYEDSQSVPDPSQLERTTRRMAAAGRRMSSRRTASPRARARSRVARRILALWDEVDVLMTPGLSSTPIPAEGGYGRGALYSYNLASRFTPWTPPFNLTGQPAVAVPAGFGSDGLPLSVQLVGRLEDEGTLYALAGQIEAARPWAEHTPPLVGEP